MKQPANKTCTRRASRILPHSQDRSAVSSRKTRTGATAYLCAACCAVEEARKWAARNSLRADSENQLMALTRLMTAQGGYEPKLLRDDPAHAVNLWHFLREWHRRGYVMRRERDGKAVFALRDACPDCLQRGAHADDCGLRFGETFAERQKPKMAI
jgi:hypothetical protein